MKWLLTTFSLLMFLTGCASDLSHQKLQLYTVPYEPITGEFGFARDIVIKAFEQEDVSVEIKVIPTIENAIARSTIDNTLWIGARVVYPEQNQTQLLFREIVKLDTYVISVENDFVEPRKKRENGQVLGILKGANGELDYALKNQLEYIEYPTHLEGLKLLVNDKIDSMLCTEVMCEQIILSNPKLRFEKAYLFSISIDLLILPDDEIVAPVAELKLFESGLSKLSYDGGIVDILDKYKVQNPILKLSLGDLLNIKIKSSDL
ncbi:amino acid ABC transporter substrate-binding protein [Aliikangiella marina]|uniref:Amino acid ABC transporter substrate-binding protein n=1 Tax=Aliikangiella marina TaxID=1712262 RepID=A0A545T7K5_9GAMM|nr:amino acid ABC transporter substrate-binding protein [Aliikangiella marina]TQV73145.1 amino acid ABC transporter substrate-binding protein [Aliikangiella marina]